MDERSCFQKAYASGEEAGWTGRPMREGFGIANRRSRALWLRGWRAGKDAALRLEAVRAAKITRGDPHWPRWTSPAPPA